MAGGDLGLVQLGQGDPAGEELGVHHPVARGEAVAVHGVIGCAPVALLQGVEEVVAALAPQGVVAGRVARRRRKIGQQRKAFGLTILRSQQANTLQHDRRIGRLGRRQIGDDGVGAVGRTKGHHRVRDGGAIGRDQIDHAARRRSVRTEQQHVQPRLVIGGRQPGTPLTEDARLRRVVERAGAPPVADQGARLILAAALLQRGGVGDGPLDRRRLAVGHQGQGRVRAHAGAVQHLFGGGPS